MISQDIKLSYLVYNYEGLNIEGLLFEPHNQVLKNGIVFLHGHGDSCWGSGRWGKWLCDNGYYAFIPSLIGYGFSEGEPDYCGPKTIGVVIEGVKQLKSEFYFDKLGVWGGSRGAIAAALVTVKEPKLFDFAIFQSGAYDMKRNIESTTIEGIKQNYFKEAGISNEAYSERSPIFLMDRLEIPVLILHGEKDDHISVEQAQLLDAKLTKLQKSHELIIVPEAGHFLLKYRDKYVFPFFKKQFEK